MKRRETRGNTHVATRIELSQEKVTKFSWTVPDTWIFMFALFSGHLSCHFLVLGLVLFHINN